MKNFLRSLSFIIGLIFTIGLVYWIYHDNTFVEKNFRKYTGLNEYILKDKYFNDSETFIEVLIPKSEKLRLLKNFKFDSQFEGTLRGRVVSTYIYEKSDFIYYVIQDGYGPYGYILFALETEGNTLQVYEFYGN